MRTCSIAAGVALALTVAACGEAETTRQNNEAAAKAAPTATDSASAYSGEGNVTAVADGQVSISHGPIEGIDWPAMTMTFRAPSQQMVEGIAPGDRVAFQFRQADGSYVLTSISKR